MGVGKRRFRFFMCIFFPLFNWVFVFLSLLPSETEGHITDSYSLFLSSTWGLIYNYLLRRSFQWWGIRWYLWNLLLSKLSSRCFRLWMVEIHFLRYVRLFRFLAPKNPAFVILWALRNWVRSMGSIGTGFAYINIWLRAHGLFCPPLPLSPTLLCPSCPCHCIPTFPSRASFCTLLFSPLLFSSFVSEFSHYTKRFAHCIALLNAMDHAPSRVSKNSKYVHFPWPLSPSPSTRRYLPFPSFSFHSSRPPSQ